MIQTEVHNQQILSIDEVATFICHLEKTNMFQDEIPHLKEQVSKGDKKRTFFLITAFLLRNVYPLVEKEPSLVLSVQEEANKAMKSLLEPDESFKEAFEKTLLVAKRVNQMVKNMEVFQKRVGHIFEQQKEAMEDTNQLREKLLSKINALSQKLETDYKGLQSQVAEAKEGLNQLSLAVSEASRETNNTAETFNRIMSGINESELNR